MSTAHTRRQNLTRRLRKKAIIEEHPFCTYCGSRERLTIDHIVPRSVLRVTREYGKHNPANFQVLCESCNIKKGAKLTHI